jgi:hypothetical protein
VAFQQRVDRGSSSRAAFALVAVAVAVVGAAVLKPWGGEADPIRPPAERAATPRPAVTPAPRVAVARPPGTVELPRWGAVAGAVVPHDEWGVRAVVDNPSPPNASAVEGRGAGVLEELWRPAGDPEGPGRSVSDPLIIGSPAPVRLLGLTTPEGVRLERMEVRVVSAFGRTLPMRFVRLAWFRRQPALLVPAARGGGFAVWTPGTYQIIATAGKDVTRLTVRIEDPTTASGAAGAHGLPGDPARGAALGEGTAAPKERRRA